MKEELINKILERTDIFAKEKLEELDEVVLERLCLIDNAYDLEDIILVLFNTLSDVNVSIAYINFYESNLLDLRKNDYDIQRFKKLLKSNIGSKLKIEALNKMANAKKYFQFEYIYKIYENKDIEYKDLIANLILKCRIEPQAKAIYGIFSSMETLEEKESIAEYLEFAKLIAREKIEYKVYCYDDLCNNKNIVKLGLLFPVANLISKCKNEAQTRNIYNYLSYLDSKNAPYLLKNCEYFLRDMEVTKLNPLYKYLTYCLEHNLLVEEDKVNLIINARNKFNIKAIEETLTLDNLVDTGLDSEAAQILDDSRKEYNTTFAQRLVNIGSDDSLSGAMIVNESETAYKAIKAYGLMSLYANTDEIGKSLEFAALINSVHSKLEIDLIYLLSQNSDLNKLDIALSIAKVLANATEADEEAAKIYVCLKNEENREMAINGFAALLQNINPKKRQKAENIINMVLLRAQNKPIHLDAVEEKANEKITTRVKKLIDKKVKNKNTGN